MQRQNIIRVVGAVFALVLAIVIGLAVRPSHAAADLFVLGETQAACDATGQTVAAGYQGSQFGVVLRQFWDNEPVFISFVFPDGRVFSPDASGNLDGIIDMPLNARFVANSSNGGDFYQTFTVTNRWPYGSYSIRAFGAESRRSAQSCFVVAPRIGGEPNAGPTTLLVEDNQTGAVTGLHGALVNIFGRGFRAQEVVSVWITAPDGTVIDYPQQFTSNVGSFASTFRFTEAYPTGEYAFTALGTTSGYQVISRFRLDARPSAPSGWAAMRVAWRFPETARQDQQFEIQGQFFEPGETVSIWATLPDNSVRQLPLQQTNHLGEFFALVGLDQRLPTGNYAFTAQGQTSGRLVITRVDVIAGSPNVTREPPSPNPAPAIIRNDPTTAGATGPATTNVTQPIQTLDQPPAERVPDF